MFDEEVLSTVIGDAAERIEIPEGAAERVLAASRVATPSARAPRPRLTVTRGSRGRRVLVAAAVILVAAGISFPLLASNPGSSGGPSATSQRTGTFQGPTAGVAAPDHSTTAAGSGSAATGSSATAPAPSGGGSASSVPPLPAGSVGQSAKVEASGSISLTIGRGTLPSVLAALTDLAASKGGFVASSQAQVSSGGSGSGSPTSGTIVLRVPEPSFAAVVSQVQRTGHATSVSTTSTDVTGQYVDLQARINALEASRQQYLTIMGQATSIGDILAVQSQLDTLQTQIEQLQGQLSVLDNETTYGTLTVSLAEAGHRPPPPRPARRGLDEAWHDGVGGFVSGVEWLIRIAGTTLFVLICLAALALLGRWGWRSARRRML